MNARRRRQRCSRASFISAKMRFILAERHRRHEDSFNSLSILWQPREAASCQALQHWRPKQHLLASSTRRFCGIFIFIFDASPSLHLQHNPNHNWSVSFENICILLFTLSLIFTLKFSHQTTKVFVADKTNLKPKIQEDLHEIHFSGS